LVTFITPPPVGGRGIVFARFLCFFVCFFVSLSATLRENGWTDLRKIFREGVERPWNDLIKFWVNSRKRVGGSKVNLLSQAIAQSQLHSLGGSRGRGLLCPAPQLVLIQMVHTSKIRRLTRRHRAARNFIRNENRRLQMICEIYINREMFTIGGACVYQGCPVEACSTFSRNSSASGPVIQAAVICYTRRA